MLGADIVLSLNILFNTSWCMDPSIKLKLMAAEDSNASTSLPCPLAVSQLVSLPADYSQLINQLSTFS